MILLIPIERATRLLSASNYPTHGDIQVIFLGIQAHLARYMNNEEFSEHLMAMLYIENWMSIGLL